jgi:hypothetical protein
MPAATAAASPPDDAARGVRAAEGVGGLPKRGLRLSAKSIVCERLVRPRTTAPISRSRVTIAASRVARATAASAARGWWAALEVEALLHADRAAVERAAHACPTRARRRARRPRRGPRREHRGERAQLRVEGGCGRGGRRRARATRTPPARERPERLAPRGSFASRARSRALQAEAAGCEHERGAQAWSSRSRPTGYSAGDSKRRVRGVQRGHLRAGARAACSEGRFVHPLRRRGNTARAGPRG